MTGVSRRQRRLFDRQPALSKRQFVRERLVGIEVRLRANAEKRRAQRVRIPAIALPEQPTLWNLDDIAMQDPLIARGRGES